MHKCPLFYYIGEEMYFIKNINVSHIIVILKLFILTFDIIILNLINFIYFILENILLDHVSMLHN